jgi:RNA polymerase sigma-70 factor (ECF subfamily)
VPNDDLCEIRPLLPVIADGQDAAVRDQAVADCIDRYAPLVWQAVRPACRDDSEADDVLQEAFIDLWRRAGNFDPSKGNEAAFVATVARRRLIDHVRRRRPVDPLPEQCVQAGPDGSDSFEDVEVAREVLSGLGDPQRRVLDLCLTGGLTYGDVADRLAMPLSTVKSHARRGLTRVREALARRRESAELRRRRYRTAKQSGS